jgi:hypothetical protein
MTKQLGEKEILHARKAAAAKQVAEKLIKRSNFATVGAAGAEAHTHFVGVSGPAKSVPLLQNDRRRVFPQPVKPGVEREAYAARVNSCPDPRLCRAGLFHQAVKSCRVKKPLSI